MFLIATRDSYTDVYRRSYDLNLNMGTVNKLQAVFDTNGVASNTPIDEMTIANYVPEIIGTSTTILGTASVPNGWQTRRLRFILVTSTMIGNILMRSYVQGYTEYHDPSFTNKLPDNMLFFINSITNVTVTTTPDGRQYVNPHSVYNVITDVFGNVSYDMIEGPGDSTKLVRPYDIMKMTGLTHIIDDDIPKNDLTGGAIGGSTSKAGNNDPVRFLTSTINAYLEGKSMSDMSYDQEDVFKKAYSALTETDINNNAFVFSIHRLTGEIKPTTFTLDILTKLDPYVNSKIYNFDNQLTPTGTILDTDHTMDTLQDTQSSNMATTIATTLDSYMADALISSMRLSFTNIGGAIVMMQSLDSFIDGIDKTKYANVIISKIKNILIPKLSLGGNIMFEVLVQCSSIADTTVSISINGGGHVPYRFPTFANSLYLPTIGDNVTKSLMVDDISNIIDMTYSAAY